RRGLALHPIELVQPGKDRGQRTIVRAMIDKFLERVVARFRRLRLDMRIRQGEQGLDQKSMRNAFGILQNHAQRLNRLLGMSLRQIEPAQQKASLVPLRRDLRLRLAPEAIGGSKVTSLEQ